MIQTPRGTAIELPLQQGLNSDTVDQDIKQITLIGNDSVAIKTQPSPHISFNGIYADGGLTGLSTEFIEQALTEYDVFYTQSGAKISRKANSNNSDIYVDNVKIGSVGNWSVYNTEIIAGSWQDVLLSGDGTLLALYLDNVGVVTLYELDVTTFGVLHSKVVTPNNGTYNIPRQIGFVRRNNVTYSSFFDYYTIQGVSFNLVIYNLSGTNKWDITEQGSGFNNVNVYAPANSKWYIATSSNACYAGRIIGFTDFQLVTSNKYFSSPTIDRYEAYIDFTSSRIISNGLFISSFRIDASTGISTETFIFNDKPVLPISYANYYYSAGIINDIEYQQYIANGASVLLGVNQDSYVAKSINAPESFGSIRVIDQLYIKYRTYNNVMGAISYDQYIKSPGQSVTPFGEVDYTWTPLIDSVTIGSEYCLLYKTNNGQYARILYKVAQQDLMQEIIPGYVKINCPNEKSLIDVKNKQLLNISSPYNAALIIDTPPDSAGDVTASTLNMNRNESKSNLIALQYQIWKHVNPISKPVNVYGLETVTGIDMYLDDTYIYTFDMFDYGGTTGIQWQNYEVSNKIDTIYTPASDYIVPSGAVFLNRGITLLNKTAYQSNMSDSFNPANKLDSDYTIFNILGQNYAYNGYQIYLMQFNAGIIETPLALMCNCSGLTYLCSSQSVAYFVSDWDNSLFAFDGGRQVTKLLKMNRLPTITKGWWSTKDNMLVLTSEELKALGILYLMYDSILTMHDINNVTQAWILNDDNPAIESKDYVWIDDAAWKDSNIWKD